MTIKRKSRRANKSERNIVLISMLRQVKSLTVMTNMEIILVTAIEMTAQKDYLMSISMMTTTDNPNYIPIFVFYAKEFLVFKVFSKRM